MKKSVRTAKTSRTCRLGPAGVRVSLEDGRVAGVRFVARPRRDDRKLARSLEQVLAGAAAPKDLKLAARHLPDFTRKVLAVCAGIKPGCVMTYAEVAMAAGRPGAARGVGQVMAKNPLPLFIPCHRVVGSDLGLRGFGGGLRMKEFLLQKEGWTVLGAGRQRRLQTAR